MPAETYYDRIVKTASPTRASLEKEADEGDDYSGRPDYEDRASAAWRRTKSELTRAEKSQDPDTMLGAVDKARGTFEEHGYPDWWSRVDRMESDANALRLRNSKAAADLGPAVDEGETRNRPAVGPDIVPNPVSDTAPYNGPSDYSINTTETPPAGDGVDPAQNVEPYAAPQAFQNPAATATKQAGYTCPECEDATMHEDDHVYVCPKCGYETSNPTDKDDDAFEASKRSAAKQADRPTSCPHCGQECGSWEARESHINAEHPEAGKAESERDRATMEKNRQSAVTSTDTDHEPVLDESSGERRCRICGALPEEHDQWPGWDAMKEDRRDPQSHDFKAIGAPETRCMICGGQKYEHSSTPYRDDEIHPIASITSPAEIERASFFGRSDDAGFDGWSGVIAGDQQDVEPEPTQRFAATTLCPQDGTTMSVIEDNPEGDYITYQCPTCGRKVSVTPDGQMYGGENPASGTSKNPGGFTS